MLYLLNNRKAFAIIYEKYSSSERRSAKHGAKQLSECAAKRGAERGADPSAQCFRNILEQPLLSARAEAGKNRACRRADCSRIISLALSYVVTVSSICSLLDLIFGISSLCNHKVCKGMAVAEIVYGAILLVIVLSYAAIWQWFLSLFGASWEEIFGL